MTKDWEGFIREKENQKKMIPCKQKETEVDTSNKCWRCQKCQRWNKIETENLSTGFT